MIWLVGGILLDREGVDAEVVREGAEVMIAVDEATGRLDVEE